MANEGIIYENGHAVIIETISQARIELQQYLQNEKCSTLNVERTSEISQSVTRPLLNQEY